MGRGQKRFLLWLMSLFVVFGMLTGCGTEEAGQEPIDSGTEQVTQQENEADQATEEQEKTEEQTEQTSPFPVTVTDATGTKVTMEQEPQRIISIMPSNTETAFALGLGERIVGVSDWDNYPEEVAEKEKIGGVELNTEKIISLEPDLILAHSGNGESIQALRDLDLQVLVLDATTLEEVYQLIVTMGKVTGTAEKAEAIVAEMKAEREQIVEAVSAIAEEEKKKVWVEVSPELYTAGKGTFIDELITSAGGINVAGELDGWAQLSEEKVIEYQPDVIFTTYGYYVADAVEQVKAREAWQTVPAVQNEAVYNLNSDQVTRSGPRLVAGLQEMASYLYPALIK